MKTRTPARSRVRPAIERYILAADQREPHHHEHPLGIGDTIVAFGEARRVVGMVALGRPTREITLRVEPAQGGGDG